MSILCSKQKTKFFKNWKLKFLQWSTFYKTPHDMILCYLSYCLSYYSPHCSIQSSHIGLHAISRVIWAYSLLNLCTYWSFCLECTSLRYLHDSFPHLFHDSDQRSPYQCVLPWQPYLTLQPTLTQDSPYTSSFLHFPPHSPLTLYR